MTKTKTIKPVEGYGKMADGEVVSCGAAVNNGLTGNLNFTNLPVDLAALKAGIDSLSALMAEALDGSKKVIAQKNRQREAVIRMLRLLGRYVEVNCKDDMAIFKSSGFQPVSKPRVPTQGLSDSFRSIDHGDNSGQIVVRLKAVPKAYSYELRCAAGCERCGAKRLDDSTCHQRANACHFGQPDGRDAVRVSSPIAGQIRLQRLERLRHVDVHVTQQAGATAPALLTRGNWNRVRLLQPAEP